MSALISWSIFMLNHTLKAPEYYVTTHDILNQVSFSWLAYLARINFFLMIQYLRLEIGLGRVGEGDQQMCLSLILNPKTSTSKEWFLFLYKSWLNTMFMSLWRLLSMRTREGWVGKLNPWIRTTWVKFKSLQHKWILNLAPVRSPFLSIYFSIFIFSH